VVEDVRDHRFGVRGVHHDAVRESVERQVVAVVQFSERLLIAKRHALQQHAIWGGTPPRPRFSHLKLVHGPFLVPFEEDSTAAEVTPDRRSVGPIVRYRHRTVGLFTL
jgi:hypothetical protein